MPIYYNYLFLENSFTLVFHKCFWYFLTNHIFKKDSRLKDLWWLIWVIFGLILLVLVYLLRAFKLFLIKICRDVFSVTPMLTALKKVSQKLLLSWKPFGVFFGLSVSICLYIMRIVSFLMRFCTFTLLVLLSSFSSYFRTLMQLFLSWEILNILLIFCTDFLVTKEKNIVICMQIDLYEAVYLFTRSQ